jgi:hypothetical protein
MDLIKKADSKQIPTFPQKSNNPLFSSNKSLFSSKIDPPKNHHHPIPSFNQNPPTTQHLVHLHYRLIPKHRLHRQRHDPQIPINQPSP